jgi:hypothetical protein
MTAPLLNTAENTNVTVTVRARVERGGLVLLDTVNLSDGAEVLVTIVGTTIQETGKDESMRDAIKATTGAWKDLIDADTLKHNISNDRLIDTRPLPQL